MNLHPISMVSDAKSNATISTDAIKVVESIRAGKWRAQVEQIRETYNRVFNETQDLKAAKDSVDGHKKQLPGILFSGTFSRRGNAHIQTHSGLLCADLDNLCERQEPVRHKLLASLYLWALFQSPTGNGLKAVFRVTPDADLHLQNFLAVEKHVLELTGERVDQACKDVARICFVSFDLDTVLNPDANELPPLKAEEKKGVTAVTSSNIPQSGTRQDIATRLLGPIQWSNDNEGLCQCPGQHLHTTGNGARDCKVMLNGSPTVKCFHDSCNGIITGINHELRSQIGKAEFVKPVNTGGSNSTSEAEQAFIDTTKALLEQRRFNPAVEPPPLRAIYTVNGAAVSTPGNLTTITAQVKSGKSAVIGAMCAAAMAENQDLDFLGFGSSNEQKKGLVWFDSEQSPDDAWHGFMRAARRAGLILPPPWFRAFCLTGLGARQSWVCVQEGIKAVAEEHGGIHSILIDGVADLVADVNDAEESNAFVAKLHDLAIQYDCPIVGVIHLNPGTEKSRGHLGSQLERKAESNLRLEKDANDVTCIWSDKQRRSPIPKSTGPCFKWDYQEGMHVLTGTRQESKDDKKRETYSMLAEEIFSERKAMRYGELIKAVETTLGIAKKTAETKVSEMAKLKVIKKAFGNLYEKGT